MKVDGGIGAVGKGGLAAIGAAAKGQEDVGYDGIWSAETSHDPFYPLLIAAEHTERIELGTGIAVAFARSPMTLASTAWDLQGYSDGRFILGLGSQIKAHIEKRFSMPWSHPAARMRELVLAMRAIWANWQDGTPLRFEGEFYRHTLMTPFFNPGPIESGPPKVFLAAVGEKMTEVAGEVCDGIILHGFTTERYVREVTHPRARARLGEGGEGAERLPALRTALRRHRHDRGGGRQGARRDEAADRVLRLDAGVPRRARAPRLGRSADRPQPALQGGQVGGDGRAHRRRDPRGVRGRR